MLTPRRKQILDLIKEGRSAKQVALELGISEQTIKSVLLVLREVYGAETTLQLIILLIRKGELELC